VQSVETHNLADSEVLNAFLAILERHKLSDAHAATLAGLSTPTVRVVRRCRELPKHPRCREAIARFVLENATARSRRELRIVV
jgi:hypothetical protein